MAVQYWSAPVGPLGSADGTAYASSTTITDVSPGGTASPVTLPGQALQLGTILKIQAAWTASNTSTPTLLAGFYYGGTAGTALAATTAITTTTAMTNWQWFMDYEGVVQTVGTSGKIMGRGAIYVPTSLTAWTIRPIPETAMAQVTIDTTVAKAITLGLTWGTSNASNTATCKLFSVETLA
jgi:hypothetical protein